MLGVLLRHGVNAEGEVISSRVELAVQYEDTAELCAANNSPLVGHETFVGAYPVGVEAPANLPANVCIALRADTARSRTS